MSVKDTLKKYFTDEKAIDELLKENKLYDQSDFDNVVAKAKENITNRYNRDYVAKTDYDLLNSEYNTLLKTSKTDKIKSEFSKLGGNDNYFNDFLKLNEDLLSQDSITTENITQRLNNHNGAKTEPSFDFNQVGGNPAVDETNFGETQETIYNYKFTRKE